jgi:hypothetical protein
MRAWFISFISDPWPLTSLWEFCSFSKRTTFFVLLEENDNRREFLPEKGLADG